eukprot:jgi/Hompol1/2074/HPOL_002815-RA
MLRVKTIRKNKSASSLVSAGSASNLLGGTSLAESGDGTISSTHSMNDSSDHSIGGGGSEDDGNLSIGQGKGDVDGIASERFTDTTGSSTSSLPSTGSNSSTGRRTMSRSIQPSANGTYLCPRPGCGKSCLTLLKLRSHMKAHNPKAFVCTECNAAFNRTHDLKRHQRSRHTVQRPFFCDKCGKNFARMDALKRHITRAGTDCYNPTAAQSLHSGGDQMMED